MRQCTTQVTELLRQYFLSSGYPKLYELSRRQAWEVGKIFIHMRIIGTSKAVPRSHVSLFVHQSFDARSVLVTAYMHSKMNCQCLPCDNWNYPAISEANKTSWNITMRLNRQCTMITVQRPEGTTTYYKLVEDKTSYIWCTDWGGLLLCAIEDTTGGELEKSTWKKRLLQMYYQQQPQKQESVHLWPPKYGAVRGFLCMSLDQTPGGTVRKVKASWDWVLVSQIWVQLLPTYIPIHSY